MSPLLRKFPWKKVVLATPAVAFLYLSYLYLSLPDVRELANRNPATTAFIELRADEARAGGKRPRRVQRWVRYERISNNLRRAVLVAEDSAFWQHDGVDVEQLKDSIEQSLERGKQLRGGSTITQQLAKNLYLSPSRNPVRKLRELLIARKLEASLTKRRILELYLNVIEWGDGIYGAEAATRAYFGKSAASVTAPEAALLAGAIINPRVHSPARPTARLRRRQQIILQRMGGVTPPAEAPAAPDLPPPLLPSDVLPTPGIRPPDAQPLPPVDELPPADDTNPPEIEPTPAPSPPPSIGAGFAETIRGTAESSVHSLAVTPTVDARGGAAHA
jgi:monofunctional biosynthetic peptidoglycan transglycosylase